MPEKPRAVQKAEEPGRVSVRPTFRPLAFSSDAPLSISGVNTMRASSEHPPDQPLIFQNGELVDRVYEIRSLLGQGGMAQVYEAHDHDLNRRIALKAAIPDPNLPSLRTEARALAAFSHPSLVTVHSMGEFRGIEYIVMERIYGVSLSEHIRQRRKLNMPFRVSEVLEPLILLAEGLAVVHRAGIAHRDVKPGNVMLTPAHRVVLMDFGLVLPEFEVASAGFIAGSPPYMPPEALTNTINSGEGQLVDIYALGVIAFEMLAGRWPFPAKSMSELWDMLVAGTVPDIGKDRPDVPDKLRQMITEMLAFSPTERPQSAEALAWHLKAILARLDEPSSQSRDAEETIDVLIVEDDDDIAKILKFYVAQTLGKETSVRRAADGVEAIEKIREREPSLMLLDLHMPKMNGIEVCMHLRGERLADDMMIVAVSAGAQDHDLQLLHQLGMHHFIQKGADLKQQLTEVLRALFLD